MENVKVLKRSGSFEKFDPQKIARIAQATGLSYNEAVSLSNKVKKWAHNSKQKSIPSSWIRDKVLEELRKVNPYAAGLYEWYEKLKENENR